VICDSAEFAIGRNKKGWRRQPLICNVIPTQAEIHTVVILSEAKNLS
jgi:hypothetical protein